MTVSPRQVRVVAALITSDEGRRVLVQQRPLGKQRELLWEFPGGKVEAGEADEQALRREAHEELGVELEVGAELFQTCHTYSDLAVDLHVYRARIISGVVQPQSGQTVREATVAELGRLPFCEADQPLVLTLMEAASEGHGRLPG